MTTFARACALLAALFCGGLRVPTAHAESATPPTLPLAALKDIFRRPAGAPPHPADNVPTPAKIALGQRLFFDKYLSANSAIACATCHDPKHGFSDGRRRARGITGIERPRNTPTLWNLAWAKSFYWDGRAPSLEAQARTPIEHPQEMGLAIDSAVARIGLDAAYRTAFAAAFPEAPLPTPETLLKAIAAYERTLVSPLTRFDRWIDGDDTALDAREVAGFRLFTGRARCLACHGGWRFTDERFHDIGLASRDPGRGGLAGITAAMHTFKTPTLRGLRQTAPYMHDGSKPSLAAVLAHYSGALIRRPSLAPELQRGIVLGAAERADLIRFLATLSPDDPAPVRSRREPPRP